MMWLARLKHITIIVLCIAVAWGIWNNAHWKHKWAERDLLDQQAATKRAEQAKQQESANREKERQSALQAAENERQLLARLDAEKANSERLIADYRNGSIRLRQQIQCTTTAASETNAPGTAAAVNNAAGKCGLPPEIVVDLIRLASSADETAERLRAAQRQICDYYQAVNGETLTYEVCKDGESKR